MAAPRSFSFVFRDVVATDLCSARFAVGFEGSSVESPAGLYIRWIKGWSNRQVEMNPVSVDAQIGQELIIVIGLDGSVLEANKSGMKDDHISKHVGKKHIKR